MNIKTFIAAAVVALTAACTQPEQAEQTDVTTDAPAVELNEDGTPKGAATETVAAE